MLENNYPRILPVGILLLAVIATLPSCSLFDDKEAMASSGVEQKIFWPSGGTEKPRIAFRQVVRAPIDIGIRKSIFTKLVDFVFGDSDIGLIKPMAVVTLSDGSLFVADPGSGGVHRLNSTKNNYQLIQQQDEKPFMTPVALATDGKRVFISDSSLGIFVLEKDAEFATSLVLDQPPVRNTGIAYDRRSKQLYIVDTVNHRVSIYDHNGQLIKHVGRRGQGDGEFNFPTMLSVDDTGQLYVTDSLNFRIQIFNAEGKFLRKFGEMGTGTGGQSRPKGVATDRFGHIYVVDSLFHSVQVFNQQGDFLINFGAQGTEFGEFWLPTGIFIDEDNGSTIYVSDSYNKRLQVFQYVGGAG